MPVRCRAPWTIASRRSSVCGGQITMSPSSRGPNAASAASIGNDSTSVGPLLPRCSALSAAIRSAPTNSTATWPSSTPADASASATSRSTSGAGGASGPPSPMTSTSSKALCPAAVRGALGRAQLRRGALGVLVVGLDDPLHEAVADHVVAAEPDELDALDVAQDVAHDDEAGALVARQVDLRDVARDDHLRVEPEPRQEHLHLLGAGVLRLVEDHERVVQRVVRQQEVVGDVERVRRGDLDAQGLGLTGGLDGVNVAHRTAAAVPVVEGALALEAERLDIDRQPDLDHERVEPMPHRAVRRAARPPALG